MKGRIIIYPEYQFFSGWMALSLWENVACPKGNPYVGKGKSSYTQRVLINFPEGNRRLPRGKPGLTLWVNRACPQPVPAGQHGIIPETQAIPKNNIPMKKYLIIIFLFLPVFFVYAEIVSYSVPQQLYYGRHNDDFTVRVRHPGGEWIDLYEY